MVSDGLSASHIPGYIIHWQWRHCLQ